MKELGRRAVLSAVVGLSVTAVAARADTITATLNGVSPSQIVGINYNSQSLGQAYAGALNWTGQASNGSGLAGGFSTYCIDLTQDVYLGQTYNYTVADPLNAPNPSPPTSATAGMGATNLQHVENLYALEYDNVGHDNDRGAAFQIAIWEMLFDTGATHDVSTGQFAVTGASSNIINLANQFVSESTAPGTALTFHNQLLALTSPAAQDQLFLGDVLQHNPGNPPAAVPTPAAAFGALPLLGGLAIFRRQKRRDHL